MSGANDIVTGIEELTNIAQDDSKVNMLQDDDIKLCVKYIPPNDNDLAFVVTMLAKGINDFDDTSTQYVRKDGFLAVFFSVTDT